LEHHPDNRTQTQEKEIPETLKEQGYHCLY